MWMVLVCRGILPAKNCATVEALVIASLHTDTIQPKGSTSSLRVVSNILTFFKRSMVQGSAKIRIFDGSKARKSNHFPPVKGAL